MTDDKSHVLRCVYVPAPSQAMPVMSCLIATDKGPVDLDLPSVGALLELLLLLFVLGEW